MPDLRSPAVRHHAHPGRIASLARTLAVAAGMLALAAAAVAGPLDGRLNKLLADAKVGQTATVAVAIMDVQSGELLAGTRERQAMIPASNLKLVTSGAALIALGKDYDFRTTFHRVTTPAGEAVVVRGSGDPGLGDHALLDEMNLSVEAFLDRIAAAIADGFKTAEGLPRVREVILDDRVFDREVFHSAWPADQFNEWYAAEVWGINFHANVLEVFPAMAPIGQPPGVRKAPDAPWLEVRNAARVVAAGNGGVGVSRDRNTNRFTLSGELRAVPEEPARVTLTGVPDVFGRLLADRLTKLGVAHAEGIRVRLAEPTEAFALGEPLFTVRTPLQRILRRCNADSHNLYAEALIKAIGHAVTGQPGTWSNGAAVIRMQVSDRLGAEAGTLVMSDGCGLSADNRITPLLLVSWMRSLATDAKLGDAYLTSIPTQSEARLPARFRGMRLVNEVRAKTGFIRGVMCFSGFVTDTASGRRIAFAAFVNDRQGGFRDTDPKTLQNQIVQMVDGFLAERRGRPVRNPAAPAPVPGTPVATPESKP